MILSRADALTIHLVVESFVISFGVICSLFLICALRFCKSLSHFGENLTGKKFPQRCPLHQKAF